MNSKRDEACIIGLMAFYTNITIRRSTLKNTTELEHFVIEGVENETIQSNYSMILNS